jgi:hypothetical protein
MTPIECSLDEGADMAARSADIIVGLIKDGYPKPSQLEIVTMTLCMLLAERAESEEHLQMGIEAAKRYISVGAPAGYKDKIRKQKSEIGRGHE